MTTTTTMMMTATTPTTTGRTMTERRSRLGVRSRVLGTFLALLVGALVVGLLAQRAVLLARQERAVEDALEQERGELEQLAGGTDPRTGEPFGDDARAIFDTFLQRNLPDSSEVFVTFVDGQPYATSPAPGRVLLHEDPALVARWGSLEVGERGAVSTDDGDVRYLATPLRLGGATRGVFVVANFTRGEREEIESTIRIEALVSLGVLLVATGVAWWTAGRLLRPVRQLTEAAESIDDTELDRRIPVEGDDEIARLARRFNEMLDRLQGAFAAQRAFVDDAGHELRTPITIIKGHLAVMGDDAEDRSRTMAVVDAELDRMARIVEDLLLLAKAEQPDFLRREPVEVADLTTQLFAKARSLSPRPWLLDACATGMADLDEQRVTQAVLNLARNALEHTPGGTEVALGSRWTTDALVLWARDRGPGVAAAGRDRVLERFRRGEGAAGRGGAGLGLAIARSVAEAHGGRLELDTAPGRGATFSMVLPAVPPPPDPVDTMVASEGTAPNRAPSAVVHAPGRHLAVTPDDDTAPVPEVDDTARTPTAEEER
jgi:two-component system OmpR family sensor kinase